MSGLIRNLLTLLQALLMRDTADFQTRVVTHFWVTPFDSGLHILKSDKYLQFAEAAQLDYLIKTKLFGTLIRGGLTFVNLAQLVKFSRPIAMFRRVRMETAIVFADDKCAYFSHQLFIGSHHHGEVLVKMKFKRGPITVPPAELIDHSFTVKPVQIDTWDRALESM